MQIDFTGHTVSVTPAIRALTEKKFLKLKRHFDKIERVHVTFDIEHHDQIATATIHIPGGQLHARSESSDLYAAIDHLIEKLDKQIIKFKQQHQHRG